MSTYVISDIHGCYTAFQNMLAQVKFDPAKDELIIAGDIVDRGYENYLMLEFARKHPENVTFLMGNHDKDFQQHCSFLRFLCENMGVKEDFSNLADIVIKNNIAYYDGYGTLQKLLNRDELELADVDLTLADFNAWDKTIDGFEYEVKRKINNRQYIIVHAGYITPEDFSERVERLGHYSIHHFNIWAREEAIIEGSRPPATIVFGHNPTINSKSVYYNNGKVFRKTIERTTYINIDCGYVYKTLLKKGNMAIIRLDDEKVFYLNQRRCRDGVVVI